MTGRKRLSRTDALAAAAYSLLSVRGQTDSPTLHEITLAVVQAAQLLDIVGDPDAPDIELAAVDKLIDRNKWSLGRVVLIKTSFVKNGHQHTNDDGLPREAGR